MTNPLYLQQSTTRQLGHYILGLITWIIGWFVMLWFDSQLDLANIAMLLVLTSAIAAMWLPVVVTLILGLLAILAFNWMFVPPRGSFVVNLYQNSVLLVAMLIVNSLITIFMASLRLQSRNSAQNAAQAEALRSWGDKLRDTDEPLTYIEELQNVLSVLSHSQVIVFIRNDVLAKTVTISGGTLLGEANRDQCDALCYATQNGYALGPHTGRFQEFSDWYFPLRGRSHSFGAVLCVNVQDAVLPLRSQLQALCDQMGIALERCWIVQQEQKAREHAQSQSLRNTLLAAISHDYRTPLAIIMGAASSLNDQSDRLSSSQQQQLVHTILNEADRLNRLTNNILQLARLDAFSEPSAALHCDWESVEEIIGGVLYRVRQRDLHQRVHSHVEKELPLLWCDSLLISLMLENLVDNALKYTPATTAIDMIARQEGDAILLAVSDHGSGVDPDIQEHIFETFYRGKQNANHDGSRQGVGVGLALCRAIALASGGSLHLTSSASGARFECLLPIRIQPILPPIEGAGE